MSYINSVFYAVSVSTLQFTKVTCVEKPETVVGAVPIFKATDDSGKCALCIARYRGQHLNSAACVSACTKILMVAITLLVYFLGGFKDGITVF